MERVSTREQLLNRKYILADFFSILFIILFFIFLYRSADRVIRVLPFFLFGQCIISLPLFLPLALARELSNAFDFELKSRPSTAHYECAFIKGFESH